MTLVLLFAIQSFVAGLDATVLTPSLFGYLATLMNADHDDDTLSVWYGRMFLIRSVVTIVVTPFLTHYLVRTGSEKMRSWSLIGTVGCAVAGLLYTSASWMPQGETITLLVARGWDAGCITVVGVIQKVWKTTMVPTTARSTTETYTAVALLGGQMLGPTFAGLFSGVRWYVSESVRLTQYNVVGVFLSVCYLLTVCAMARWFHVPSSRSTDESDGHAPERHVPIAIPILRLGCTGSLVFLMALVEAWFAPACTFLFNMDPSAISLVYVGGGIGSVLSIVLSTLLKRHLRPLSFQALWSVTLVLFGATLSVVCTYDVSKHTMLALSVWFGGSIIPLIIENNAQFTINIANYDTVARWLTLRDYLVLFARFSASLTLPNGLEAMSDEYRGTSVTFTPLITWSCVLGTFTVGLTSVTVWIWDAWCEPKQVYQEEEVEMLRQT